MRTNARGFPDGSSVSSVSRKTTEKLADLFEKISQKIQSNNSTSEEQISSYRTDAVSGNELSPFEVSRQSERYRGERVFETRDEIVAILSRIRQTIRFGEET